MRKHPLITIILSLFFFNTYAQQLSSAEIFQKIKKLNVLGNVLYLAAHPDDENTRFISYCANEKMFNTGYLSLTRGSGGQNLIGTEIRDELGIIRTQELLSARKIDGGEQFFSRANDFGYSKNPKETLEIWDHQKILADVVWVIRKFRPDIIVCRFPTNGKGGHGHHTSSALLASEAFELSADSSKFKEHLKYVNTWKPKRVVINTGRWWNDNISDDDPAVVSLDIGGYNKLLGTSYNELAALSRSMHKSQGFGSTGKRGEYLEYFEYLKGDSAKNNLFEGVDFSWKRAGENTLSSQNITSSVHRLIDEIIRNYNGADPSQSIPRLIKVKELMVKIEDRFWREKKIEEVEDIILQCSGLFLEMTTLSSKKTARDSVSFTLEIVNRSNLKMQLKSIACRDLKFYKKYEKTLKENHVLNLNNKTNIPKTIPISQPFWLLNSPSKGSYNFDSFSLIGNSENHPSAEFEITVEIGGQLINYKRPLIFKWNDPVKGEQTKNWIVCPKVTANINENIMIFSEQKKQSISVTLTAHTKDQTGAINIIKPEGWEVIGPKEYNLKEIDQQIELEYQISPQKKAKNGFLEFELNSQEAFGFKTLNYDHIKQQTWFPKSKLQLSYLNLDIVPKKIGYLMGAGDLIPDYLKILNYDIELLSSEELTLNKLKNYDVIITGVRFFNVNESSSKIVPFLMEYTKQGGNVIVQYNTSYRLKTKDFSPYPIKISRDRVTQEDAPVTFLNSSHPVMNYPNKILKEDFDSWVQERGLYFPNGWSKEYETIFSWNDRGEKPKKGSLLIAKYGKGYYTYTGISFFRQLPQGVSGAYKLLVNIISLNNE
ncbi:MAG: LmbE family protein [Bacteroidetes bacterium MED-G20]|nr:MAG: LmbE family protein [Bacteroidetes bacterium MED-G20]